MGMGGWHADVNQAAIELVLADLEVALTFAHSARASSDAETRSRNRLNAREAFFKIRDELLPLYSPDNSSRAEIEKRMTALREQLEALGEKLS